MNLPAWIANLDEIARLLETARKEVGGVPGPISATHFQKLHEARRLVADVKADLENVLALSRPGTAARGASGGARGRVPASQR